jgi:hypothetical protein
MQDKDDWHFREVLPDSIEITREELRAAWDKAVEGTIIPRSNWPVNPEMRGELKDMPNYYLRMQQFLFGKADV